MIKIYDTLTKQKEDFKPVKDNLVGLYTCGPTVYDSVHIGNLRAYIFVDLLKRTLMLNGFEIKHVMNITDIDDKTIKKSNGKKEEFTKLTKDYEEKFWLDVAGLNIIKPNEITRPTQFVKQIVEFVDNLLKKGYAYKATDGSIYFSINKFKNYGKLSGLDNRDLKVGARVAQDEYAKENPADFALWKAWTPEDGEIYWDPSTWLESETLFEKGRPGWHIECSVMSTAILGPTIDIHTGGIDLVFPHHENEIAQSEAGTGQKFVNFWVHNEHLMVDSQKMSKSLGNIYTLDDIKKKGFDPLDFRYFVLGAHYRSKLNFTWQALEGAKNARERLVRIAKSLKAGKETNLTPNFINKYIDKLNDDLDIPSVLALVWEILRDKTIVDNEKYTILRETDKIFGLELFKETKEEIPQEVLEIARERKIARQNRDWEQSDKLRDKMLNLGWKIEDQSHDEYKLIKSDM